MNTHAEPIHSPWPRSVNDGRGTFLIALTRAEVRQAVMGNFVIVTGNVIGVSGTGLWMRSLVRGVERLGGRITTLLPTLIPDPTPTLVGLFQMWSLGYQSQRLGEPMLFGNPEAQLARLVEELDSEFEKIVADGVVLRVDVKEIIMRGSGRTTSFASWSRCEDGGAG